MMQIVKTTHDEKVKMYNKLTKKQLVDMLVARDEMFEREIQMTDHGCKSWDDCINPNYDCINCPVRNVSHSYITSTNTNVSYSVSGNITVDSLKAKL